MALQDLLILDHFMYSFPPQAIKRLTALCGVLKSCETRAITRPDGSYEGVYLFARDGSYFEMLKQSEHTPPLFALSMSCLSPGQETVKNLPSQHPQLQWHKHQIKDSDNKPWYTYYGQVPIEEAERQGVLLWAMEYHNLRRHRPYQHQKKPPSIDKFSVQEFKAMRVKVPRLQIELLRERYQWIPGDHSIGKQKAVLRLMNPSFDVFEVSVEVDKEKGESKPVSLTMLVDKNAEIESQETKGVRLTRIQNTIILNF
ncbi:MAG: hypothetical protein ACFE9O_04445 [Promethearchaeota archaeon]